VTNTGAETNPATELRMRFASAAVLIVAAVFALVGGTVVFALLVAVFAILALMEWHRLVNAGRPGWEALPAALTVLGVVALALSGVAWTWGLLLIVIGALVTAAAAAGRHSWVLWHSVGVVYVGIPALALITLRATPDIEGGGLVVGGVFVAVWTADTCALFVGRLLGGPRLAPKLSPKKTWSGLIGGIVLAGVAEAIYVTIVGGSPLFGAVFGIFIGIVANFGDLFESWVKRVFHTKNSGNLIPGHGGMLDRVDSLLFAAPAAAAFLFFSGHNSLVGAHL